MLSRSEAQSVLIEYYPDIRTLHVVSVMVSGALFMIRGLLVQLCHQRWAMAGPVRYASYFIDSILLVSALLLVWILPWAVLRSWLPAKLVLVVVYIVLGTFALKRGRSPRVRRTCLLSALLVFAFIVGIAIARHPGGWLYLWMA